jgi:hypothetical protein
MAIEFPGESAEYRAARDRLLEQEIELRRAMEAVAAARRGFPPGGVVPPDYVFQAQGPGGAPAGVRLSALFAPGKDSLVIYNMMFPVPPTMTGPVLTGGRPRCCRWQRARVRPAPRSLTSWTVRPSTSPSASISRSPERHRLSAFSPSPPNAAGDGCACCPRPGPLITATIWLRHQTVSSSRC